MEGGAPASATAAAAAAGPRDCVLLKSLRLPDGRAVRYAASRLRRDPGSPAARVLDPDDPPEISKSSPAATAAPPGGVGACWVLFYPMGPNRRLLGAVLARYAPRFECHKDVLFLCVNRPGRGGTSPPSLPGLDDDAEEEEGRAPPGAADERRHVRAACDDVAAVLDRYGIERASLLYLCAGSTFAYAFAARRPDRTTGRVVGIASWVLRSEPPRPPSASVWGYYCGGGAGDGNDGEDDVPTPEMHSRTHRMAMGGCFGPRRFVSWLVGSVSGGSSALLGILSPETVGHALKKELSEDEGRTFDEEYPGGAEFAELLKWIHGDGRDDEFDAWANGDERPDYDGDAAGDVPDDGNARDCAVCLSSQQDLGLVYRNDVPPQRQILLWHGEDDKMISVRGAEYLEAVLPNATLTKVRGGTHQGTMFFLPEDAMEALNRISRDVSV